MPTLIVLIGPTGVGKTELSLRLAENFQTHIVSADSRQLYAELKIGTAAPTPEQLERVPHHLVGTLHLTDYYSAAQYEMEAMEILEKLFIQHDVVVFTGGSMMYVLSLIHIYTPYIYETQSSIVLVNKDFTPEHEIKATLIKVDNAYESLAKLLNLYEMSKPKKEGIDSLAFVAPSAKIGENVYIGAFAYIGEKMCIRDRIS